MITIGINLISILNCLTTLEGLVPFILNNDTETDVKLALKTVSSNI